MKKKTAAVVGLAASVLGLGIGVNQSFTTEEILRSSEYLYEHAETDYSIHYTETLELSSADQLRAWFIGLPVALKAVLLLPLWALGAIPAAIVSALAASPIWAALCNILLQAAALLGVFALVYKLIFPDKKLRDLFKKKNLKWILAGTGGVVAADWILSQVWGAWTALRIILMLAVGAAVLALLWTRICGKFKAPEPQQVETILTLEY